MTKQELRTNLRSLATSTAFSYYDFLYAICGMDMRATLLGGTLAVQSSAETGTEIRVEIPTTNWLIPFFYQ